MMNIQASTYSLARFLSRGTVIASARGGGSRRRRLKCLTTNIQTQNQHEQQEVQPAWDYAHPQVVDVTELAQSMRQEVRRYTSRFTQDICLRLAGILVQDVVAFRDDAEIYSERIAETLAEDGIVYELYRVRGTEPQHVEAAIRGMNERSDVHGILVFYPIFKQRDEIRKLHRWHQHHNQRAFHLDEDKQLQQQQPYMNKLTGVYYKTYDDYLRDVVTPAKDVEGLNNVFNARWHFRARGQNRHPGDVYVPCTALSVTKTLEAYHTFAKNERNNNAASSSSRCWRGTTVTIINRSEILGRPLAAMLALKGATVFSVDESSILTFRPDGKMRRCSDGDKTLEWCLQRSSIVVTGVPTQDFRLPVSALASEREVTVVNVSEFDNVCVESLLEHPGVKYIPHVGKVTVAALEQNLVKLHQRATS